VFERLDEHSQRVIDLAQHGARGLYHNYLGTEHLLVGLARAGGTVATLLAERHCTPDAIRAEILTIIGRGQPPHRHPDSLLAALGIDLGQVRQRAEATFGTDAITHVALCARPRRRWWPARRWWPGCNEGRPRPSALVDARWLGLTPRVKTILDLAARRSAPAKISPPQLMLAILEEAQGLACQILTRRHVDLAELAATLRSTTQP
jgi:ATP-dependent Clp protease ATP-binding subunit ClpA